MNTTNDGPTSTNSCYNQNNDTDTDTCNAINHGSSTPTPSSTSTSTSTSLPAPLQVLEHNTHPKTLSDTTLRLTFMIMGMGTLFVYNSFVSCIDYFNTINTDIRNVSGQMVAFTLSFMLLTTICWLPVSTFSNKYKPLHNSDVDVDADAIHSNITVDHGHDDNDNGLPIEGNSKAIIINTQKKFNSTAWKRIKQLSHHIDVSSPSTRVLIGFSFTFIFLLVFLLLPPPSISVLNLFSVFIGIADATSQSGLYVLAASYERPSYSAAAVLGAAMSGFVVSLLRLMTRSFFATTTTTGDDDNDGPGGGTDPDGLRKGAYLLLGFSFVFSFILIIVICIVKRDIHQCNIHKSKKGSASSSSSAAAAAAAAAASLSASPDTHTLSTADTGSGSMLNQQETEMIMTTTNMNTTALIDEMPPSRNMSSQQGVENTINEQLESGDDGYMRQLRGTYMETLRITWRPTFSAFFNFFITLSLFPAVIVSIPSSSGFSSFGDWLPVVLITVFNAADCAGRYILWFEGWRPFQALMAKRGNNNCNEMDHQIGIDTLANYNVMVWWPTFARCIFFPLLALCIIPSGKPYLHNDLLTCVIVFVFGLSNGFIHCANFAIAPTLVESEDFRNAASLVLLIAIFLGLTLGAYFGIVVENVIWLIAEYITSP